MEIKRISKKQEKRISSRLNSANEPSRVQKASGAMWNKKSDVISSRFRIEAKTKVRPSLSITVKKEWLRKIQLEAWDTGKIPVLAISFGDGKDYYILDEHDFINLIGEGGEGSGK